MADFLHFLAVRDKATRAVAVRTIIGVLMHEGMSQTIIGQQLTPQVTQPTIAHWASGYSQPDDAQLLQLAEIFFGGWHYLCSFSKRYGPLLPFEARRAFFEARHETPLSIPAPIPAEPSILIDLHIRPARLVHGALAHTFANDIQNPSVFVVLVQKDLPYNDQYRVGWEEVSAHIIQRKVGSKNGLAIATSIRHFQRDTDFGGQKK